MNVWPEIDKLPVASMRDIEAMYLQKVIWHHKGHLTDASKTLKIGRATLYRKMKFYDLKRFQ